MAKLILPTQEWIIAACEADDNSGWCLACGEETDCVEPDAARHECDCCGKRAVYGAEELLIRGAFIQEAS